MRRTSPSRASVFGVLAACAVLALTGAGGSTKKAKEVPPKVDETISDVANILGSENNVEGVGLVVGLDGTGSVDGLGVLDLDSESELFSVFDESACPADVAPEVFEQAFSLAVQLSAEGREGRRVGALFVLGDSEQVLAQSRSLVLNPFHGHP